VQQGVYLPKFGWSDEDGDGGKVSAYYDYDLVNRQYYPKLHGLMEPMNSIWIEPKASRAIARSVCGYDFFSFYTRKQ
jgi:hypothetical protein